MLNDLYNINAMKPCKLYLYALIMPGHIKKGHAKLDQITSLTGERTAIFSLELKTDFLPQTLKSRVKTVFKMSVCYC